ncbi:hypothetical protein TeGR_g14343, partial [Tetraparma gracilis]
TTPPPPSYPEKELSPQITSALAESAGMQLSTLESGAASMRAWLSGKSASDVEAALKGEGSGPLADLAGKAKGDEFWLYSRFFGIGLVSAMEAVGAQPSAELMDSWVSGAMGKNSQKAVSDLDAWNGLMSKLSQMTTLMKEIEIREKKKMAQRLEEKAQMLEKRQAREELMKKEVDDKAK